MSLGSVALANAGNFTKAGTLGCNLLTTKTSAREDKEMKKTMHSGNKKYAACFYLSKEGLLENVEVVEGNITKFINDTEVEFTGIFQTKKQAVLFPKKNIFNTREQAQKKIEAALAWKERNTLRNAVGGNIGFLPPNITKSKKILLSGNPLRCGEPMIAFGAQTNTWGKRKNPQKILQIAGAIWEDIETLKSVLYVLGFANDYTKKLIGKYIVTELNSLFMCFINLSELDPVYQSSLFPNLLVEIKELESKYTFKAIRDKVAAHRDTNIDMISATGFWKSITRYALNQYISVFANHLNKILIRYPNESDLYFRLRNRPLNGIDGTEDNDDYYTFDEPFAEKIKMPNQMFK
jgi:hypothetical protein